MFSAIRGPKVLQEAWDKTKTVRQKYVLSPRIITSSLRILAHFLFSTSYEALGLAASLTPVASGGVERSLGVVLPATASSMEVDQIPENSVETAAESSDLRKGFGRIVRDASGNVVDIQLPEDEEAGEAAPSHRLVEDDIPDPSKQTSLAPWVNLGSLINPRDGSGTHVVQSESGIDVNHTVHTLMQPGLLLAILLSL